MGGVVLHHVVHEGYRFLHGVATAAGTAVVMVRMAMLVGMLVVVVMMLTVAVLVMIANR
jgi:hypothetical protein